MSVNRLAKYQTADPFTRIPNTAVRNDALDLKALGLLVVMLSKPDGWRFTERNLANDTGVGRGQLRTAMGTLIDAGYVVRRREVEGGRPVVVTEVYDTPQSSQGSETEPSPQGPVSEGSVSVPSETGPGSNEVGVATNEEVTNEGQNRGAAAPLRLLTLPDAGPAADPLEGFEEFWAGYPRRDGKPGGGGDKKPTRQKWRTLSARDRAAALAALPNYSAYVERPGTPHPKHAVTWLNQEAWETWQEPATPDQPSNGMSCLANGQEIPL